MFKAFLSILVYVPLSDLSCVSVRDQLSHPYSRMDSTVDRKNRFFRSGFMSEVHILVMPLSAFHAKAFRTAMSFAEESTQEPRYLKSSLYSRAVPS